VHGVCDLCDTSAGGSPSRPLVRSFKHGSRAQELPSFDPFDSLSHHIRHCLNPLTDYYSDVYGNVKNFDPNNTDSHHRIQYAENLAQLSLARKPTATVSADFFRLAKTNNQRSEAMSADMYALSARVRQLEEAGETEIPEDISSAVETSIAQATEWVGNMEDFEPTS